MYKYITSCIYPSRQHNKKKKKDEAVLSWHRPKSSHPKPPIIKFQPIKSPDGSPSPVQHPLLNKPTKSPANSNDIGFSVHCNRGIGFEVGQWEFRTRSKSSPLRSPLVSYISGRRKGACSGIRRWGTIELGEVGLIGMAFFRVLEVRSTVVSAMHFLMLLSIQNIYI